MAFLPAQVADPLALQQVLGVICAKIVEVIRAPGPEQAPKVIVPPSSRFNGEDLR